MTSRSSVYVVVKKTLAAKSVDQGHTGLRPHWAGGRGNGTQVFSASVLTVLQLISLSVGL